MPRHPRTEAILDFARGYVQAAAEAGHPCPSYREVAEQLMMRDYRTAQGRLLSYERFHSLVTISEGTSLHQWWWEALTEAQQAWAQAQRDQHPVYLAQPKPEPKPEPKSEPKVPSPRDPRWRCTTIELTLRYRSRGDKHSQPLLLDELQPRLVGGALMVLPEMILERLLSCYQVTHLTVVEEEPRDAHWRRAAENDAQRNGQVSRGERQLSFTHGADDPAG